MVDLLSSMAVNFGTSAATKYATYWADDNYKISVTTSDETASMVVSKLA